MKENSSHRWGMVFTIGVCSFFSVMGNLIFVTSTSDGLACGFVDSCEATMGVALFGMALAIVAVLTGIFAAIRRRRMKAAWGALGLSLLMLLMLLMASWGEWHYE